MIRIDAQEKLIAELGPVAKLTRFMSRVQIAAGLEGEVDVLLSDDATLRRLNRAYRGKDKATDVLSFPAMEMNSAGPHAVAGDLAISLDAASRQAAEYGLTLEDEVRILLLHGALHLAGYDHETDAGEMAERETTLREKLRLPTGLIARVERDMAAVTKAGPATRRGERRGVKPGKAAR